MTAQTSRFGYTSDSDDEPEPMKAMRRFTGVVCYCFAVAAGSVVGVTVGGIMGLFSGWLGGKLTNAFYGQEIVAIVDEQIRWARFCGGTGGLIGAAFVIWIRYKVML